jgi:hypothetical protein
VTIDHKTLRELAEAAPQGDWQIWTSNSWRRIYAQDGRDTVPVIEPCVQRHDNHPDMAFGPGVAQFIENAGSPATVLALLDEIEALKREHAKMRIEANRAHEARARVGVEIRRELLTSRNAVLEMAADAASKCMHGQTHGEHGRTNWNNGIAEAVDAINGLKESA